MARRTIGARRCFKDGFRVAIVTNHRPVRSLQQEIRRQIVIERRPGPFLARVARAAISTAMSCVTIVFQVAAGAGHVHNIIKQVFAVAISTAQGRVFKLKRKISVTGVVETRVTPRTRVVAGLAIFAASASM